MNELSLRPETGGWFFQGGGGDSSDWIVDTYLSPTLNSLSWVDGIVLGNRIDGWDPEQRTTTDDGLTAFHSSSTTEQLPFLYYFRSNLRLAR